MAPSSLHRARLLLGALVLLPFSGCSLAHFSDVSSSASVLPAMTGNVHGGQQPVAGATIALYSANITTNKGASTPIPLTTATTSDASGNFSITGKYVCSNPNALVYITATGGNPGLAAGTNNSALALMTALGTCGDLLLGGNSINISINELTTVAAIEALAPFMADLTHVGADLSANANALAVAFASANAIVSSSTGQFATASAGTTLPVALYNTLANILAACVNGGGNSGSTSNCGQLFSATSSTLLDIVAALLYLLQHAGTNVSTLYGLSSSTAPFQPQLPTQPADFTSSLTVAVPNTTGNTAYNARLVAVDGLQHIWVANYNNIAMHVYDQSGKLLYSPNACCATLYMTADSSGNIWAYGASGNFTKFSTDGTGTMIAIAGGYLNNVSGLTADNAGNIYLQNTPRGGGGACAAKFSSTGVALNTAPGLCSTGTGGSAAIATDAATNVYLTTTSPNNLFEATPSGTTPLGVSGTAIPVTTGVKAMRFDPGTSHLWLIDGNSLFAVNTNASVAVPAVSSSTGIQSPVAEAIDGSGNVWFTNTVAPYGIGEISATGTLLSPTSNGFQPAGLNNPQGIAIDAYGNIWVADYGNATLQKIPALAVPRNQQYY